MAMAGEIYESLHIISLVINRRQDIALVRAKAKLLAHAARSPRLLVTQVATAASEMSRLLWQKYGGGKAELAIIHSCGPDDRTGIELLFEGRKPLVSLTGWERTSTVSPSHIYEEFAALAPVRGARSVLDSVVLAQGMRGMGTLPVRIKCLKWGLGPAWEELQHIEEQIRRDLFADTEESYVENLKVKHDEVLKLLREKSARTRELDRANSELLLMSRSLEEMAEERTMVEMSLRIADRIRNPATVIGGLANLLAARSRGDEKELQRLTALKAQAEKLEEAVRDFDQLAARARNLFQDENLSDIVNDALSLCVTLGRKKIRPNVLQPDRQVVVRANRRTLTVALLSILRHAADFTEVGGEVTVKMATHEDRPCITVYYPVKTIATAHEIEDHNLTLNLAGQILAEHQGAVKFQGKAGTDGLQSIAVCLPLFWREKKSLPKTIPPGRADQPDSS
jgi:hypothetical protein